MGNITLTTLINDAKLPNLCQKKNIPKRTLLFYPECFNLFNIDNDSIYLDQYV